LFLFTGHQSIWCLFTICIYSVHLSLTFFTLFRIRTQYNYYIVLLNTKLDPFLNTKIISAAIGFSGSNMAALLLSCLGITTSKLRAKQKAKKERKQEYDENFDFLKEQNANRVRQLSNQGEYQGSMDGRTLYGDGVTDHGPEMQQHSRNGSTTQNTSPLPPKYDDITDEATSRHSG
jgi:hypothetical protein